MDRLLIIDGTNLLWQMFCGMPSIINENGKAIQGTMGFVGALRKIIKMTEPTHIIVIFDGEHGNFRAELSDNYKANRPYYSDIDDENPFSYQYDDVRVALDFMKIKRIEAAELFEADDIIASYALTYGKDMQVFISSSDSDFFQLINDTVSILRYRGGNTIICDRTYVQDKYGILTEQYADFKSLTGDNSDNIKGVEKVGVKTAAALINQFGNLQNIIYNTDKIKKPSIRESISKNTEQIQNNYKLIKLDDRAAIPLVLNELVYIHTEITTNEVLKGIKLLNDRRSK